MDTKDLLKRIIRSFHAEPLPHGIMKRDIEIPVDSGAIISVIGSRRAGKTYLVLGTIQQLLERGVPKESVIYINFEDERLIDLKVSDLDTILQSYRELYPDNTLSETYIFLDEIQNVDGWEKFVRRIHESITKRVYITGSNSKLLSTEIATELRGRTLAYEVFPLSFKEYLRFKGVPHTKNDLYAPSARAKIINGLEEYLLYGGFPEVLSRDRSLKTKTLQEYLNVMVMNDLVKRYDLKSLKAAQFFVRQALNANTKEFSINKIYNSFRSVGIKISNNTLYDWLEHVRTIYLAFVLNKYVYSDRLKEQTSKKIYVIDSGLYNAVNTRYLDDTAKLLENAVFLQIYRNTKEVSFYKDEYSECDFIVCDQGKPKQALQVCYSLASEETRKREIRGLLRACKALGLDEGTIVTYQSSEPETEEDGVRIHVVAAAEYLLG
ncbi:MAG: ATP-binding protein [Candidatus Saccharimonadales bacterium]